MTKWIDTHTLETLNDDQMDQSPEVATVPASVAGQSDNDQRGSGAAAQHPQPGTPPLVAAEDELATLVAGLLSDGLSIGFAPNGDGVDVYVDPSDDDGEAETFQAFGPDPLAALRVALDILIGEPHD